MKKIDHSNYQDQSADELNEALSTGTAGLVQVGLSALVDIVQYIGQAIGQRKALRKRIEVLENVAQQQLILNKQLEQKIFELEQYQRNR